MVRSPLQLPQLVDVDRQAPAVDRDDQAEADRDLAGRDDHHHQREDLPAHVAVRAREGDQREVGGVEHQLQAEQDHERVAAGQHAAGADAEDQRGDDQVPGDGSSCAGPPASSHRALGLLALGDRRAQRLGDRDLARVGQAGAAAGEDDRADGRDQQQQRGDLEGDQVVGQEQLADLGRLAEARLCTARPRCRAPRRRSRSARSPARRTARTRTRTETTRSAGPDRPGQPGLHAADVADDEDVEHHHGARVDDHLRRGDELRAQQQEQHRQEDQVADEREHE